MAARQDVIQVRGARTHNLKNVDVDLPRGQFVVVTGPSGSGKSSFVFDTVFAEGRRRFLETLSLSARQVVGQLARPDVDAVIGLPPTVAVGQALGRAGRLSTVGTLTGLDEDLRLLFARLGTAHCPTCGTALTARTVSEIVERITTLPERTKLIVLAPIIRETPGDHAETLERIVKEGFVRVRIDGATCELADVPPLDSDKPHSIDIVVDRLIVKSGFEERLRESIDLAVEHGQGTCVLTIIDADRNETDRLESTRFACAACDVSYPNLDPRTLSFESPYGACESCRGTGQADDHTVCLDCGGDRINQFARCVTLEGVGISTVRQMQPADYLHWLDAVSAAAQDDVAMAVWNRIHKASRRRVTGLDNLGLGYLALNRSGRTLSGGELQRARLVNVLSSGLTGVCYVLDEPTSGLHAADTSLLVKELQTLRDSGATVLTVEHDPSVIQAADFTVCFGPRGGSDGGHVLSVGPETIVSHEIETQAGDGQTGDLLDAEAGSLSVASARLRTLKEIDVEIPLRSLVGVAGISGSGKTTFVRDVLAHGVQQILNGRELDKGLADGINDLEQITAIATLDQTPPGRSSRSCPATVLGIWGPIRTLLSRTKLARLRGFEASRFSFNNIEGQCPQCRGRGFKTIRVRYLPPSTHVCSKCHGQRFEPATRTVMFKDHSVSDLLALTVEDAAELFENIERIARPLRLARDAGLGYLPLGQPSDTVSGGEAQRLKLVQALTSKNSPTTLFVLDEPTSGLSVPEVGLLVGVFRKLIDAGHSVICVEHHLNFLAACDHLIEFGPGAGDAGGYVVSTGSPTKVAGMETATGLALRTLLRGTDR